MSARYNHFNDPTLAEDILNDDMCMGDLVEQLAQTYPSDQHLQKVCAVFLQRSSSRFHYVQTFRECTSEQLKTWQSLLDAKGVSISPLHGAEIIKLLGMQGSVEKLQSCIRTWEPKHWTLGDSFFEAGKNSPCYEDFLMGLAHFKNVPLHHVLYLQGMESVNRIQDMKAFRERSPIRWTSELLYEALFVSINEMRRFEMELQAGDCKLTDLADYWGYCYKVLKEGFGLNYPYAAFVQQIQCTESQRRKSLFVLLERAGITFEANAVWSIQNFDYFLAATLMHNLPSLPTDKTYMEHEHYQVIQPLLALQDEEALALFLANPEQFNQTYVKTHESYPLPYHCLDIDNVC